MPSGKTRSKDDTWTTDELSKALKGSRDDMERKRHRRDVEDKHRRRDDDDRRRRKDELNGHDDRRRPHHDDEKKTYLKESTNDRRRRHNFSPDPEVYITEEERERQRRERREKREKKDGKTDDKRKPKKDEKIRVIDDDGDYDRHRRDKEDDPPRKQRDRRDDRRDDERRRVGDTDDYRKRHRDDDRRRQRDDDVDKLERSDKHRREKDRESKHKNGVEEKRDHRKDERRDKDRDRQRDREKDERRDKDRHREKDKDERRDKDRDKHRDREKDDRKEREKQRDKTKVDDKKSTEHRKNTSEQEVPPTKKPDTDSEPEPDEDEEPYYEDDFEDYEDDFEDDEDEGGKKEGEMDEVLKALDEENTRLLQESRRSNWSDSTELSDERFRETSPKASRGRTFINFVSAKERVLSNSTASRTRRRADDLAAMIDLDLVAYDMFDMPPVNEYEMYIRSFGRSDTKQVYVQTNEDNLEHEVQTEEIDTKDKWTQHPAEDLVDCGGDGIDSEESRKDISSASQVEMARLGMFLERASQTIGILLEEEHESQEGGHVLNTQSCCGGISDGYSQFGSIKVLQGRHVVCASFCPSQPDMILTLLSMPAEDSVATQESKYGLLCVWNVNELSSPQKILGCNSQPMCCCFSPTKAMLAFSGMVDGSVAVWDLREPASIHRAVMTENGPVRFPTFNTAGIVETDNHHSPVTSITPVFSVIASSQKNENLNDLSTGLSFQLATLEENGIVCLWVIAEISNPDTAGSELDLGLAPGGRVKLMKSSSITIENPRKEIRVKTSLHTCELQLLPSDLNHFYVATDCGFIVHGVRFGSRVYPRAYSTVVDNPVTVTSIDISPFCTSYIIAGCDDGSLHMYHTKSENPLISLSDFSTDVPVVCVRWSRSRPAVFFVLSASSTVCVFDIIENSSVPVQVNKITQGRVVSMCLSNDPKLTGLGSVSRPPQLLLSFDDGRTEIHTINKQFSEPQTLEEEFLEKFVDKF